MSPDRTAVAAVHLGQLPLIISLPHVGTTLPLDIAEQMNSVATFLKDTDWHVQRLYQFARESGASWLQARISRYAIDVNRPPDGHSLYPGQTTSGLCPTTSFAGEPLYDAVAPSPEEIGRRKDRFWVPYHSMLRELIEATRGRFGYAVLLDAHSIRSRLPLLFDGQLPDINIGTNGGKSCSARLVAGIVALLERQTRFSHVVEGRFKGGYITRHYGNQAENVHAIQIELAQRAYMDETSIDYEPMLARPLQSLLRLIVTELAQFDPTNHHP